ncbi:MAG: hypothetical protein ACE5OZ_00885 [Candidatus Heimdallarchaeota archaeon]
MNIFCPKCWTDFKDSEVKYCTACGTETAHRGPLIEDPSSIPDIAIVPPEGPWRDENEGRIAFGFRRSRYLMKNMVTHPSRAIKVELWTYFVLFLMVLLGYATVHAGITAIHSNFSGNEVETFSVAFLRVFLTSSIALGLGAAGATFFWFVTEDLSFSDSLKRLMFFYTSIIIITLLGEVFLCKIILESDLKLQPAVVLGASALAIVLLHRAMISDKQLAISLPLIVFILALSYVQGYMIIDDILPYTNQENIESPITAMVHRFFEQIF